MLVFQHHDGVATGALAAELLAHHLVGAHDFAVGGQERGRVALDHVRELGDDYVEHDGGDQPGCDDQVAEPVSRLAYAPEEHQESSWTG
ncbi:MAG: hypothetical protein ACR2MY_06020 [Candidatus Dormibacteria bacterium]